jgi:hypothetical protein
VNFEWGAFAFGLVIGWFTYFVNRYRAEVTLSDVAAIIGALGGAAVLALFPAKSELFSAYGIGLAVGFFGYFLVLVALVVFSKGWTGAWFLDGRRPKVRDDEIGGVRSRAMGADDDRDATSQANRDPRQIRE